MANTTTMLTRAQELDALLAFAAANGYSGSTEKLHKVLAQWCVKRERPAVSTTKQQNLTLAAKLLELMPLDEAVTTAWVTEQKLGILTSNKAAVIMGLLIEQGYVSKCRVGKVMTYTRLK